MQIVIDIPEEEYNIIKNFNAPMTWAEHLIAKGTPLPKGHGDLIDIDNLYYKKNDITQKVDFYAPVIIKADVESNP